MWKSGIEVTPVHVFNRAITFKIQTSANDSWIASFVYGSCLTRLRSSLWEHLTQVATTIHIPWILCGDFNEITGNLVDSSRMHDFQNFISHNGLLDAGFQGNQYTGSNNLWELIESCNELTGRSFPLTSLINVRFGFDHTPFCLTFQDSQPRKKNRFIFPRMWADHPQFIEIVAKAWDVRVEGLRAIFSPGK